jgi:hypothetical protein
LLDLCIDFAEGLADRRDQIRDCFLPGFQIALGLALEAFQRLLRDLEERKVIAFQRIGSQRLERVLEIFACFGQQLDLFVAGLSFQFQCGLQPGPALQQLSMILRKPRQISLYGR